MGEWQPIESAPKDGTAILVVGEDGQYDIVQWDVYSDESIQMWEIVRPYEGLKTIPDSPPTHWMPLPEPPK